MIRTAGELKKFLEDIPDSEKIYFYHGGLSFSHESSEDFENPFVLHLQTAVFGENGEQLYINSLDLLPTKEQNDNQK